MGIFLRFGRAEHELDVFRRFLQRLQQAVERSRAQHVDFVDDVNLEAGSAGTHVRVLPQFTDIVDSGIAGAVDFQHVNVIARTNAPANIAFVARRGRGAVDAVQRLGEDTRSRGLSGTPSTDEKIGMPDSVRGDGVGKRL